MCIYKQVNFSNLSISHENLLMNKLLNKIQWNKFNDSALIKIELKLMKND